MEEVIKGLWVGSDEDVPEAKKRGYSRLACAKDGPDGHRAMLGYTTMGAPKGPEYLFAERGHWAAMNIIDVDDPSMIPDKMIDAGLKFIHEQMSAGRKILVHCNAGHSRGPSTAMLYLRTIGELPQGFKQAKHVFKTLYRRYDPGHGMEAKSRSRWQELKDKYNG